MRRRRHAARWVWSALTIATIGCQEKKTVPAWHQEAGYRWRELDVPPGDAGFTSLRGEATGIQFENTVSDSALLGNRLLGQGAGVALGDVDSDGLVDVFLARTEGCSALYRNLGHWKFEDITTRAGVGACDRYSTGSAFADVDGDGDLDLVLLATKGPNAIFLNDGRGAFTERRDMGLDPAGKGGTTVTMADVDGDARLDLYVANYRANSLDDSLPPQRRALNQVMRRVAPDQYEIVPEFRHAYKLVMRPDMGGLGMSMRGGTDEFYRNEGGRFTNVPLSSLFRDSAGRPLNTDEESFTLAARFADLNGDGAPDLYVTNDFEQVDQLWFNDGQGAFRLAGWHALRQMSNSSMGLDVADVNGDGLPDLFVDDMLSNDSRRLKTQIPTHTSLPKKPSETALQLQQQRNVLFVNRGDGTFSEVAQHAGVTASGWSWGTMFMDVDLDGWQDLLVANGHLWDIMDADTQEGLQNRLTDVSWQRAKFQFPRLPLKNVAFRNRGDLTFEDASNTWRFGTEEDISHSLAAADLDGDGDLDVVVNRLRSPALVLRNDASAPRVAVRVIGDAPNTRAVGSKIRLLGGALPRQEKEVAVGGLYLSHSDYAASFAMGTSASATIEVDWRDGRRTSIDDVRPNRLYEITASTATQRVAVDSMASSTPLFEDVTAQLGGHRHTEDTFDDWDTQYLLPTALSQLGPGVAWFDLDRDGDEDLVIGTGKGGRLSVFRNDRGRLVATTALGGPVAPADFTTILGFSDERGTTLLAGVSTWQLRSAPEIAAQASALSMKVSGTALAAKAERVAGPQISAAGALALGDYDNDGDLDLFVGARAVPMRYPLPASSGLFHKAGGTFAFDAENSALLRDIGLVTSAVFADVNGDGHADLVLAREWGSLVLLLNDGRGRFVVAPTTWGLSQWTSRWNGITSGDLNGDGLLDLVATSWGRNTNLQADSTHPLFLYHGPIGANGEEEMLLARHDARIGSVAPLSSYARTRIAVPDIVARVNSFASYADASMDEVLGPLASRMQRLSATTLDHVAFMNRGDHFDAVPLPSEAQRAPASYAGIADFDGNGTEDVFLSQNFFPTSIGMPRYDAGRGLLLAGDGKGGLLPMSGARTGVIVYGDQRGAAFADFNGDARLDLVVTQNGETTRLFANRSAQPGLRVRLRGPPGNPDGVGALMRVVYGSRMGPAREVHAGSGYWSQNGAVQVFGLSAMPTGVWVRWPGGKATSVPVPAGAREVTVDITPSKRSASRGPHLTTNRKVQIPRLRSG